MNGIYDFEKYRTPYLDTEMLIKRKQEKQRRKLIILSLIASTLMFLITMFYLYKVYNFDKEIFVAVITMMIAYIVIAGLIIMKIVRKGEYIWQ
ncbi:MAG: hypothetical protein J6L69_07805 [Lachnospiraceae bacterium]|nr:hypothetical protein [Lachnospiraceae bacterium]